MKRRIDVRVPWDGESPRLPETCPWMLLEDHRDGTATVRLWGGPARRVAALVREREETGRRRALAAMADALARARLLDQEEEEAVEPIRTRSESDDTDDQTR